MASVKYLFIALRPSHWVKNLLIFLPLVFGRKLFSFPENFNSIQAFVLFSAAASAVYLLNDVFDVKKDRAHRLKRLRPLAAGKVGVRAVVMTAALLAAVSIGGAFCLSAVLGFILGGYCVLNLVYSRFLKDEVILDVFCVGASFVLRVLAGAAAADVELSHWMIFMILLLSLFLGFTKRRQEIMFAEGQAASQRSVLSRYSPYFIDQIIGVLTSSIVIVYMLYTVDGRTVREFGSNRLIYSIPFVYYGIFRYFYLIHKERGGEDPVVSLLSDRVMQLNLILWLLSCVLVIYTFK